MRTPWTRIATFSLTTLITIALASSAYADRRSSLAGNMLIEDQDDIYTYPQLALEHRNLVSFDFFPGASLTDVLASETRDESTDLESSNQTGSIAMGGAGLLLFGQDNFAFGISSHREDIYGATPQAFMGVGDLQLYGPSRLAAWGYLGHSGALPANMGDSASFDETAAGGQGGEFLDPLQLADILLALRLAPQHSIGARLSVGVNSASIERLGQTRENKDSWSTTAFNVVLGYSMTGNFSLDLNLELGLNFFSNQFVTDQQVPDYDDSATVAPSFSLSGRSMIPLTQNISLGVLGLIHVNSASFDDEFGATAETTPDRLSVSSSNFFIEVGAGPVYELPDNTTIAAYGTLGFGQSNYDFDSAEEKVSTTAFMLPGFKLALEHWLWDWMAFRSGLASRFYFQSQSREFGNDALDNISSSHTYYEFLWSTGVGIKVGNFEFNGTFQTPFVTNGPEILGGTGSGLFTLLNATYKF